MGKNNYMFAVILAPRPVAEHETIQGAIQNNTWDGDLRKRAKLEKYQTYGRAGLCICLELPLYLFEAFEPRECQNRLSHNKSLHIDGVNSPRDSIVDALSTKLD